MNWCGEKSEGTGVGGSESWGDIGVTQLGWLYGSGQVHHLPDGVCCPGSIPGSVGSYLWGNVPREGVEGQVELAERDVEGCKYATSS